MTFVIGLLRQRHDVGPGDEVRRLLQSAIEPRREGWCVVWSPRGRSAGVPATALLTAFAGFSTFWSFGDFYYEGWGTPFPQPPAYLTPFATALSLGAASRRAAHGRASGAA
jgi:hypothetical protein